MTRQELDAVIARLGLDVPEKERDEIAAAAEVDPTAGGNPVKFDRAAARQVFAAALDGKL